MKFCAIILLLVAGAECFLRCSYSVNYNTYQCDLTINNPNGLNNFTEIEGVHLKERTNTDVAELHVDSDTKSISANVPSIICDTFPNLVRLDLSKVGLTEIGDGDFAGCARIIDLHLEHNNISSISSNAFIRLTHVKSIDLLGNNLTTLPENVFVNQQNLTWLRISSNPLNNIPIGIFRSLEKLDVVFIDSTYIDEMKSQWFANSPLDTLFVNFNSRITALPESFIGLEKLRSFLFTDNEISEIRSGGFTGLTNLEVLYLDGNKLTELQADTFTGLGKLEHLFVAHNPIEVINEKAFQGLDNLRSLNLESCRIRQIQSNHFENLRRLTSIALSNNEIEELPEGVFGALQLVSISVSSNLLKVLHRNSFGSLQILNWFAMNHNNINAVDRAIINDAVNLETIFFFKNLCASFDSRDFVANRTQVLPMLDGCFDNYQNTIDTTTESNGEIQLPTTTESNGEIQLPTTTESNGETQLPVYQIFQNDRYKGDFGFSFKFLFLFCSILSVSVLLAVLFTIYLIKWSGSLRSIR